MGNLFSNDFAPGSGIKWSNARTDDFLFTWLLAANDEAHHDWELLFAAWLGERTQFWTPPGTAGFDVFDLPWDWARLSEQREFLLRTVVAAKALLELHRGGVIASGFVDDGMRFREHLAAIYPPDLIETLDPALHAALVKLQGWLEDLPLDALLAQLQGQPMLFSTPWRDEPFPDSAAGLRRCRLHGVMYAPRTVDRGCVMCEDRDMRMARR